MGNSQGGGLTLCDDRVNRDENVVNEEPFDERKHLTPDYYECEKKMLGHTGLPWEEFKVHNVVIDDKGHYVRTIEVGFTGDIPKEKMVLIHGYGGSSIMFWKIMKPLAEHFHLIMIDILGMGASSRPEFTCENEIEAREFFIGWMETWR